MKTEDFNYELPDELIAQTPLKDRSSSRLLVLDKESGEVSHSKFSSIVDYLGENDVLVLNDTKVLPARLFGLKEETGAHIELLLLKEKENNSWECLVKPAKRVKEGTIVTFGDNLLKAECISVKDEGMRTFKFIYDGIFLEILEELGEMPLPPYIHEKLKDQNRYQTVYAKEVGSAAAPTAGLHFTDSVLEGLKEKGVEIVYLTLHVGLGTFRPVSVDDINKHKMHSEYYELSKESAAILSNAKELGKKIVSVGTTSTRTLETVMQKEGKFTESSGWTDIFIYPGYKFKAIDSLITNFHLPKSTLVMLVSALAGKANVLNAYKIAVDERYRFFSFGDSMFIK